MVVQVLLLTQQLVRGMQPGRTKVRQERGTRLHNIEHRFTSDMNVESLPSHERSQQIRGVPGHQHQEDEAAINGLNA